MGQDAGSIYNSKINYYTTKLDRITKRNKFVSYLRLILFFVAIISIYLVSKHGVIEFVFLVLFVSSLLFVFLVRYHSNLLKSRKMLEAFLSINKAESVSLTGDFSLFDTGTEFIDHQHQFAIDLDLFGDGSLFQFLNRTVTRIGKERLANKLKWPVQDVEVIKQFQHNIQRIKTELDFRQKFMAIGMANSEEDRDKERIMDWINLKPLFNGRFYYILVVLIPLLTVLFTFLVVFGSMSIHLYIFYLMIPWAIAASKVKHTNKRHMKVSKTSDMLVKYGLLLQLIEEKSELIFEDSKKGLEASSNGLVAGKQLKKLSSILNALDNRLNPVSWALLNAIFLWDVLQMIRLERWQKRNRKYLGHWFDVIAEVDSTISFANFWFNHPKAIMPEFAADDAIISAKELGHPLIHKTIRVHNDVKIYQDEFLLITGANMAGKSTYLRTVGVNLVLAMCGCPVLADSFHFAPLKLYTSIRTQDSLFKSESYFYAELKRLKAIIDELRSGNRLFIILDEILKGTNSKDKHKGSEALLEQLISLHACGIVATHDIGLGEMQKVFFKNIKNKCFEVDISGDKLTFNYKLQDGVSKNMNATLLMRQMGITI